MKTWHTKNGFKINHILSDRANAYLISKGEFRILIDTGRISSFRKLLYNFYSVNLAIEDIDFLILTHTHYDHCQSARDIKEKSGCKIIISKAAATAVEAGYTSLPNGTFLVTDFIVKLGRLIGKRKFGYKPFEPDMLIDKETAFNVADKAIEIVETPGHSLDSISVIIDQEIAIVGDTLFGVFKHDVIPPFADDIPEMIKSWGKLLGTKCKIFLPGHGKEITPERLQQHYKKYAKKYLLE